MSKTHTILYRLVLLFWQDNQFEINRLAGANICLPDLLKKKKFSLRVAVTDYTHQFICSLSHLLSQPRAAFQHAALWMSDPAAGRPCVLGQLTPSKPSEEEQPSRVLTAEELVPKDCLLLWLIYPFSSRTHYFPITATPIKLVYCCLTNQSPLIVCTVFSQKF